ncbi:MAG: carbon starvation protein A [Deltaproteobacteria bacterium]|nr:carbon starvation protein A [Deltaproteobacteria bacterium]
MSVFLLGLAALIAGYTLWGRLTEGAVRPDPRRVPPAFAQRDGVDFMPLPTWRVYLVQLLNIAGLGPVFGPILGALWGPQVFLWVVLGSILGGAVHDFLAGAMSMRHQGEGLPELIGRYLGAPARHFTTFYILGLMVLVGTVFVKGPAMLVVKLLPPSLLDGTPLGPLVQGEWLGQPVWLQLVMVAIFAYYIAATMLPIDKLIGRVYPWFAVALLVMVGGIGGHMVLHGVDVPSWSLANTHPEGLSAWPVLFITVSCGAVSGFHATQSPMMARCLVNERHMRLVFYGAMIGEGVIALVWAAAAQGYYSGPTELQAVLSAGGPAEVVFDVATRTLGTAGAFLALVGVVVLPITSGDTAFRVARLIAAEYLRLDQRVPLNRYLIAVPLFGAALALNFADFSVIWRYFGWMNQTLSVFALWTGAVFLRRTGRWAWLAVGPALFMTAVTVAFICVKNYVYDLDVITGTIAGVVAAGLALALFLRTPMAPAHRGA